MNTFEQKTARNARVQRRYDELMREGRHGHYETMFRVVREEVEAALAAGVAAERERIAAEFDARDKGVGGFYDAHEPAEIIRAMTQG